MDNLINSERAWYGLPALHCNSNLQEVAHWHTFDQNSWKNMGGNFYDPYCGMHSWPYSNEYPYKQCCYERDGMECMWYKPDELGSH